MPIRSNISSDGKQLVIRVNGRFDFNMAQAFKEVFEKQKIAPKAYVVDLENSDYLDSAALEMLLALREHAGGDNANISIINCPAELKKILITTKLSELITVK